MAKKVSSNFGAGLVKNLDKGGAWRAEIRVVDEGIAEPIVVEVSAWANASAGKRWIKSRVQALTPRKSVKMIAGTSVDAKGKPADFYGSVAFKREI